MGIPLYSSTKPPGDTTEKATTFILNAVRTPNHAMPPLFNTYTAVLE
jgi:hypothetical protein